MKTFHIIQGPFDRLESFWEGPRVQRFVGTTLVIIFLVSLALIELNIEGILPAPLSDRIPLNHFYAVQTAFNLLLIIEVISLVLALARSLSDSVGKQFEIFSLILLRNSFKEFVNFEEPIRWLHVSQPVYHILSDSIGALFIFFLLGVYYRIQKHHPIIKSSEEQSSFIAAKKFVSMFLLLTFVAIGAYQSGRYILQGTDYNFYSTFYTILIFSDILLILISIRYCSTYQIVFRNSGFALVTVVIRLALIAPPYYGIVLGIGAMLFALGLTLTYNKFEYGLFNPTKKS